MRMTTATVHDMMMAIVTGRLVVVVGITVGMPFGGLCDVRNPRMLVMIVADFRQCGLETDSRKGKENRDQNSGRTLCHAHGSIA